MIKRIKKHSPYHSVIRQRYVSGKPYLQSKLLQLEKNWTSFTQEVTVVLEQWIRLWIVSPNIFIELEWRHIYENLLWNNDHGNVVEIEHIKQTEWVLKMKIQTNWTLTPQELISGKPRAKIIEALHILWRIVRSISYDELTRMLHIAYYTHDDKNSQVISEIINKLELGFTELDMKNNKFQYPEFQWYEIIDKNPKTQDIYTIKCTYSLPPWLHTSQLSKQHIQDLNSYVRLPVYEHKIKPHQDSFELYIQLSERDLTWLAYSDFPVEQNLRIPLWFDLKYRKPVYSNFDGSTVQDWDYWFCPHYLIAWATWSGKSTFIKYLIAQLLRTHTPDTLRLFLVDPKVVSFNVFKNLPHLYAPIVSDTQKISSVLEWLITEVNKRYDILAEYGVESIVELKGLHPEIVMPHILVIIDEFADIIDSHEWKVKQSINLCLKKLWQKARAAWVHMMLMTQRATSANIDGEIKANFSWRVSFRVASEWDSHTIIGEWIAADIERPGEGYARLWETDELVHFQVPYIPDSEMRSLIRSHEGSKMSYIDEALSEVLLRKPLLMEQTQVNMLWKSLFPKVAIWMNLETHETHYLHFARSKDNHSYEPTPHVIVSGATNSWKSMFGKLLITQLMKSWPPELIQLVLIDSKVVSFSTFAWMPHLYTPVVTKHEALLPTLEWLLELIQQRYVLFKDHDVENITQWREQVWENLPSIVIVIDEFADLLDSYDYKWRAQIEKILKRFGQMARAAWVHMVLITQRATSQNIPGEIRTHFSGRIAFRMNSESDSFYILDQWWAEQLESAWRFLYKTADWIIHQWYAPMMTKQLINEYKNFITL